MGADIHSESRRVGEQTDNLGIRVAATLAPALLFVGILYPLFSYSGKLVGFDAAFTNLIIVVLTLLWVVYRV